MNSSQDANRDGTKDLKCGRGYYVYAVTAEGGAWGLYPAFAAVGLWCRSPGGTQAPARTFGELANELFHPPPVGGSGRCEGANGALTGLNVSSDRYIKTIKARCGEIFAGSGQRTRVDDDGYLESWIILGPIENNDTQQGLRCGNRKVVTGLRIRYREDSNETAFTSLQLFCSTVSGG